MTAIDDEMDLADARQEAWNDWSGDNLTDGNDGHVAAPIWEACWKAFVADWPNGREAAEKAALAMLDAALARPRAAVGEREADPFDDCLGVHVEANARRHGLGHPRATEVDRECQAVWRSAMADAVGALDVLKGKWLHSRRKNEREAGAVLGTVLDALWSAREPAARSYREAFENGKALIDRIPAIVDRPPQ